MLKKILLSTIMLTTIILTSCFSEKESIDVNTFTKLAENKNLIVENIEETITTYDMDAVVLAYNENNTYQVEFYDFNEDRNANAEFNSQVNRIKNSYSSGVTTSTTIGGTSSFTYKVDDEYYAIIRVDDTMVYAYSDDKEIDLINEFLKELGYK